METKRFYILLAALLMPLAAIWGQNVKISGKVIDNEDKPVEFATVRIAGTAIGTNTDLQGLYQLTVAPRDTIDIIFSCIGFKTVNHKLIKPQGELTVNVRM